MLLVVAVAAENNMVKVEWPVVVETVPTVATVAAGPESYLCLVDQLLPSCVLQSAAAAASPVLLQVYLLMPWPVLSTLHLTVVYAAVQMRQ